MTQFIWLAALVVAGVGGPSLASAAPESHDAEHGDAHEDGVRLTAEEIAEFGIVLAEAGGGDVDLFVSLPGEIQPNDDRVAHIVPRYSGIVVDVRAQIGDHVKQGDVLAVVESDDALTPYELKTMIDGTIIAKHITRGEAVSREKGIYLIADLSSVWVDVTVYQRDLDRITIGQEVHIYTGHDPVTARGTISYIKPVLDERTRTTTARVVLPNPQGAWRPGMFITAKVLIEHRPARVVVPPSAIHTLDERAVVFVETPEGFLPQEVELGLVGAQQTEILAGLEPGMRYVVEGGFTIKAELGKGSLDDGHGH